MRPGSSPNFSRKTSHWVDDVPRVVFFRSPDSLNADKSSRPKVTVESLLRFIACPFLTLEMAAMVAGTAARSVTIIFSHDESVIFFVLASQSLLLGPFSLSCEDVLYRHCSI
jgi:hypothetical protein